MDDDDDYPTDEDLAALGTFAGSARDFFALVRDLWSYPDRMTEMTLTDGRGREVVEVRLATGGWSGNEAVVEQIQRTTVHFQWWEMSQRGGLTTYRIPVDRYDATAGVFVLASQAPA